MRSHALLDVPTRSSVPGWACCDSQSIVVCMAANETSQPPPVHAERPYCPQLENCIVFNDAAGARGDVEVAFSRQLIRTIQKRRRSGRTTSVSKFGDLNPIAPITFPSRAAKRVRRSRERLFTSVLKARQPRAPFWLAPRVVHLEDPRLCLLSQRKKTSETGTSASSEWAEIATAFKIFARRSINTLQALTTRGP